MVPFGARRAPQANALPTGASTRTAVIPATTRRRTVRVRAMASPLRARTAVRRRRQPRWFPRLDDPDEPGRVGQSRGHPPGEPRALRRTIPMDAERRIRDEPQPEEPRAPTGPVPRAAHDHRSGAAPNPDRAAVQGA